MLLLDEIICGIRQLGIDTIVGVPDSTLNVLCNYLNSTENCFEHFVTPDEGAALSIAIGHHLATGKSACVYMQNSGIGNIVNPLTSIANENVYGIPVLFMIGWRGVPHTHDEPQHKFMGAITLNILELLNIKYSVLNPELKKNQLENIFPIAKYELSQGRQYALIIQPGSLTGMTYGTYQNNNVLIREDVLRMVLTVFGKNSVFVSTTGKISRELYEQSDMIYGHHDNIFMVIGGMGYANMIAYEIARQKPDHRLICLDGDGSILMHMGNLAFLGGKSLQNYVHICLNNHVHESVGGMPTSVAGSLPYSAIAKECGYKRTYTVKDKDQLEAVLCKINAKQENTFVEVMINVSSRQNLGRPKELPAENKKRFMETLSKDKHL